MSDVPPASLPPAAWHTDPGDPTMLRWWDGAQWTEHRHPKPPGWGAAPAAGWAGGQPAQTPYGSQPDWGGQPGWGVSSQQGWGGAPQPGWGGAPAYPHRGRAGWGDNHYSWIGIAFAAVYITLALATGFVLLGIVPAFSAARAMRRGERLAPLAVVAAVLTIGSAIFILVHRHHV